MIRAEKAEHLNCFDSTRRPAQVIAFPTSPLMLAAAAKRITIYRFSLRDRIAALDRAETVQSQGIRRVVFESAADFGESECGEFLLIYQRSNPWATWGIGCNEAGFTLWRTAYGTTLGQFCSLSDALRSIELNRDLATGSI